MIVPDAVAQRKVLDDFLSHMHADRVKLSEALAQGDRARIEDTAHRMKGSCRMVGANNLAKACEAIEQAARNGDMVQANAGCPALDEALERLKKQLASPKDLESKP
jgi:HPt (histidine-containing phosphotransfer) domain-containing protein